MVVLYALAVLVLRIVMGAGSATIALLTFGSAVRTVVVPRAEPVYLTRVVFISVRWVIRLLSRRASAHARERALGYFAPVALIALPFAWLTFTALGYVGMYYAAGVDSIRDSFRVSMSSLTTLGFATTGTDWPGVLLSYSEACVGLIEVALLISFLPTMYGAFVERESTVAYLGVRAGTPPSAVEMIIRYHRIGPALVLDDEWIRIEVWFNQLAESHTTFMALPFFRSPNSARSWITTAGAVLDAAALSVSTLDREDNPRPQLAIRAGYSALREIADSFDIEFDFDPAPGDPITVHRDEWERAADELAAAGVAVKQDRDQAWRDFAGWRVTYDKPLVQLATLLSAPMAMWSSDRALGSGQPRLRRLLPGMRTRS